MSFNYVGENKLLVIHTKNHVYNCLEKVQIHFNMGITTTKIYAETPFIYNLKVEGVLTNTL